MLSKYIVLMFLLFVMVTPPHRTFAQKIENSDVTAFTKKWRISLNGGVGYRLASTKEAKQNFINSGFSSSEVDGYFDDIKWGPKASAQIHYLLTSELGVGIDYQLHHSSGSMTGPFDPQDGATVYYGKMEDNIYTNYIGLSFYAHQWLVSGKLDFYSQGSVGLTMFREENVTFYTPTLITGKAPGVNAEIGLEYFVTPHIALGISLNCFFSTITKIKVDDGNSTSEIKLEEELREGLSRLDANAGIKFYF